MNHPDDRPVGPTADPQPLAASRGLLVFALVFPSLVTWLYFVALADQAAALQQGAYGVGKAVQFAFPLVWVLWYSGEKLRCAPPGRAGWLASTLFGLAVAAAMLALYHLWLSPAGFFDGPDEQVRDKVRGLGLDSLARYAALGVFYALGHSFLEEYYWRWFVFRQLRRRVSLAPAIAVSSLGFMAHHILLLAIYFGWTSPATYLFSLAVAVGGAVWAWLYERSGSLFGPWLSHCLVDAAIFILGYDLVRDLL